MFHALERGWTTSDYLLAHIIDGVRITAWQRTEGASKRPPRDAPDPFPRPGDDSGSTTGPQEGDIVSAGSSDATVTTVGKFLELREKREQLWRDRHNKQGGG